MDRSQDVLATLSSAVYAGLRAATTPGYGRDGESDGLLSMLSNPDFMPPPLRDHDEVRSHPATAYDDLPPLEDDVELPSASSTSRDDLLSQDDDEPPPLEADDSSPIITSSLASPDAATMSSPAIASTAASSGISSSVRFALLHDASTASAQSSTSHGVLAALNSSGRTSSRPARVAVNAEDDGAESDGSLPSLQSVSDSSSDEEDYVSESGSEWDENESLDDSDGESDIARLVGEAETVAADAPHNPTGFNPPTATAAAVPEIPSAFQSYRELLDRARVLIPNIEARLGSPPDLVIDIATRLSNAGASADNDAERAETLIQAMEVVPDDLVLRYEKLRSADGEDVDGCAICRDDLVDKSSDTIEASHVLAIFALLPFPSESVNSVAFPCAGKHLFHKHCLLPWLARKTTCPSCRFDIDPHSLTLRISRGLLDVLHISPEAHSTHLPRAWRPPQVEGMRDWLVAEEKAKETGIPRVRPDVVMPEYATASPPTDPSISEMLGLPSWGTNPETGRFDMTTAYRDIQDLREHLSNMEERRRAAGLPTRPPSAPPVTSLGTPLPPFPQEMFGGGRAYPARDPEYERLRQQIAIERYGEHVVPFHNFPASLMDHVVNLTSTPVSRGAPPNSVEVDVLAHVGNRLDAISSLDMYSQVLRDFQNRRRSANLPQHPPPAPAPIVPVTMAPPRDNLAPTATASPAPAIPHPVAETQEGTSVGSTAGGHDVPPSSGHNPMEELD